MSLLNILRSGLKTADKITKPLQATVTYMPVTISTDGLSTKTWPTSIKLRAVVDFKQKSVKLPSGEYGVAQATVTLLDLDSVAKAAPNGIDNEDRFQLPNGVTTPVLTVGGFIDAGNGRLIPTEVYL